METLKNLLLALLKAVWKLFIILLWGAVRVTGLILQQVEQLLHNHINKTNKKRK